MGPSLIQLFTHFTVSNLTSWLLETSTLDSFILLLMLICVFFLPGQRHMPQTDWIKSSMFRIEVIFSTVRAA